MEEDFLPLDVEELSKPTGNVYKSVSIISSRANQLTLQLKDELQRKLAEFAPAHDNLDEITENREQIEISRYYERKPKPSQDAVTQFRHEEVYYRDRDNPTDSNAPELYS
ncbi:MAG: hypothetical protein AAGN35_22650 [Bacteroidota bacterium]